MEQKMLFCFNNISSEILLPILGYSFFIERHILAHFWVRGVFPASMFPA
jgi:hypothetical protein